MNRLARLSLLPAACAFVAACASAAPHPPRDEPPEMVSRGPSPVSITVRGAKSAPGGAGGWDVELVVEGGSGVSRPGPRVWAP